METDSARVPELTTRPLTPDDWPVVERLFGTNGACGGCWCMWWRVPQGGKLWDDAKGGKNKAAFRRLVKAGDVHAVLAFAGDESAGWCSFGPHDTFPRMRRVKALQGERPAGTWSVVCFYIPARWRGRGVATRLLAAATERAFALGASAIEGYPVVPRDASGRMPGAFAWTGVPAVFEAAGYEPLPRPAELRPVYVAAPARRPRR